VRDGTSINFQKASCTLDGCVKIYASRVDSVVDETGKLINGLADGNWKNNRYLKGEDGVDAEGEALIEDEEQEGKKRHLKRASRHVSTLETSPEALNLKQFDLEYAADPLFKKTCAEFDESNSRGMLLHNLNLSATCQVIFDSSDSVRLDGAQAEEPNSATTVNIAGLKGMFAREIASVSERKLCAAFADYSLSEITGSNSSKFSEDQLNKAMERLSRITIQPIVENGTPLTGQPHMMEMDGQVFDAPVPAGDDYDDGYAPLMDDDYGIMGPGDSSDAEGDAAASPSFDANGDLIEQQAEGFSRTANAASTNMFSYFDQSLTQAWAGPNHWKVRRPTFIRPSNAPNTTKTGSKKKEFSLQFDDTAAEIDIEALFAKPANASTITLTKAQIEERSQRDNLLPEDLHFSSQHFLRLFTKPSWRFGAMKTMTRKAQLSHAVNAEGDMTGQHEEVQGDFWARHEEHPEGVANAALADDSNPDPFQGIGMDDDYGAYNGPDSGSDAEPDATLAPTQDTLGTVNLGFDLVALKAGIQIQRLAFSRVAKRVDVHKLKTAMWEELENSESQSANPSDSNTPIKQLRFSNLVQSLDRTSYPKEGLKDVSVSYCFICLLHLANEQGLTIQAEGGDLLVLQPGAAVHK